MTVTVLMVNNEASRLEDYEPQEIPASQMDNRRVKALADAFRDGTYKCRALTPYGSVEVPTVLSSYAWNIWKTEEARGL